MPTAPGKHINKLKAVWRRTISDRNFLTPLLLSLNCKARRWGPGELVARGLREKGMVMFGLKLRADGSSGRTDRLLTTTLLAGAAMAATLGQASAQTPQAASAVDTVAQADAGAKSEDRVVVTGSRIPRSGSDTTTAAPV